MRVGMEITQSLGSYQEFNVITGTPLYRMMDGLPLDSTVTIDYGGDIPTTIVYTLLEN